jgi:hypothetical protein
MDILAKSNLAGLVSPLAGGLVKFSPLDCLAWYLLRPSPTTGEIIRQPHLVYGRSVYDCLPRYRGEYPHPTRGGLCTSHHLGGFFHFPSNGGSNPQNGAVV